jgi:hypothetical protein
MVDEAAGQPQPNAVRAFLDELLSLPWDTDESIGGSELVSLVAPHIDALREAVEKENLCGYDHRLTVWYTSDAVREHLEAEDQEETNVQLGTVTDEDLATAAGYFVDDNDALWERFADACHSILDSAVELAKERAAKAPA